MHGSGASRGSHGTKNNTWSLSSEGSRSNWEEQTSTSKITKTKNYHVLCLWLAQTGHSTEKGKIKWGQENLQGWVAKSSMGSIPTLRGTAGSFCNHRPWGFERVSGRFMTTACTQRHYPSKADPQGLPVFERLQSVYPNSVAWKVFLHWFKICPLLYFSPKISVTLGNYKYVATSLPLDTFQTVAETLNVLQNLAFPGQTYWTSSTIFSLRWSWDLSSSQCWSKNWYQKNVWSGLFCSGNTTHRAGFGEHLQRFAKARAWRLECCLSSLYFIRKRRRALNPTL